MGKDWIGDKNSVYKTLGSSHHSKEEREENDYYATEPRAVELLLQLETFNHYIWEPACGEGHIAKVLEAHGHKVVASDLINRGYGIYGIDFFNHQDPYLDNFAGDIITNPPYSKAKEFIQKALDFLPDGSKIAMFLKVQFMEGKGRKQLFLNTPPPILYMFQVHGSIVQRMAILQACVLQAALLLRMHGIYGLKDIKEKLH